MIAITDQSKELRISGTDESELRAFQLRHVSRAAFYLTRDPFLGLSFSYRANKRERGMILDAARAWNGAAGKPTGAQADAPHAPQWKVRILYAERTVLTPPATMEHEGRTVRFTGFGRSFLWNSDRNGCDSPDMDGLPVRYAYYA